MRKVFLYLMLCLATSAMGQSKTTTKPSNRNSSTNVRRTTSQQKKPSVPREISWQMYKTEGDELLGTKPQTVAYYEVEGVGRYSIASRTGSMLKSLNGIFDYDSNETVEVIVGFYDKSDSMVRKTTLTMHTSQSNPTFGYFNGTDGLEPFLIDKSGTNHHVRLIVPCYGKPYMDLTLPMIPDEIVSELFK